MNIVYGLIDFIYFLVATPYTAMGIIHWGKCNTSKIIRGKTNLRLIYTEDQLTFPNIQVWYKFKATNQSMLDYWKDKRISDNLMILSDLSDSTV